MKNLNQQLNNPSQEYRALPFWSWNDKLEENNCRWQIQQMKEAGMGGFFMHARGGLGTEYMKDEWMHIVKACAEEGKKNDMKAWLYDEEGWPSGFGGGYVTGLGDYYHMKWMECIRIKAKDYVKPEHLLGIYDEKMNRYADTEELDQKEYIYVVSCKSNCYYIDILNHKVVEKFIECTHEKYRERFGELLGGDIPGFFTDEPQFARLLIPWSYILEEEFVKRTGYSYYKLLPALFFDGIQGSGKFRYDYWKVVNELYTESFCKQIYEWCEANNCRLTGHVMREDSLWMQMTGTAGVMPSYEYIHMPGIDWLRRKIISPITPKQVGSAAGQFGKKFVLSEMFAMTGWNISFEEMKWIAQWQYVNGVNIMCHHLLGYSIRGIRKRDYPPSLYYQQPWWKEYKSFNDYFARLGVLLTTGKVQAEVLLLHPVRSAWVLYDGSNNDNLKEYDTDFTDLSQHLADLHIDHHYGDEGIMKKYGRVENGKLQVGKCAYSAVILPSMVTIDRSTVNLLEEFMENGGNVFSMGRLPEFCEGEIGAGLENFIKKLTKADLSNIKEKLGDSLEFEISLTENGSEIPEIHYQMRNCGDYKILYMVNLSRTRTSWGVLSIPGNHKILLYHPEDHTYEEFMTAFDGKSTNGTARFLPAEAYVFLIDYQPEGESVIKWKEPGRQVFITPGAVWDIEGMDNNSITLDYCAYAIDGGEWHPKIPVIEMMEKLLKRQCSCRLKMKFEFEIQMNPENNKEFYLVAELAEEYMITVNGKQVQADPLQWWVDKSFRKIDIRQYIREGTNVIILERHFYQDPHVYEILFGENVLETEKNKLTLDTEIESIYLAGDFSVLSKSGYYYGERNAVYTDGPFVIGDKPLSLQHGDFVTQGLVFFAGKLRLSQRFYLAEKEEVSYIFRLGKPYGVTARLYINGKFVRPVMWEPYDTDITGYLEKGMNKVEIELFGSNRNLLGPHHHVDGELYAVCPANFTSKPGPFEDDPRENVWTDTYCFVSFGV